MSLAGALAKLQKKGVDLYIHISQFFSENSLIRASWVEMAGDLDRQAEGLKRLPGSFWNRLKADPGTSAALELCANPDFGHKCDNRRLSYCFSHTLDFEEPLILRAYVPLIRVLRTEWTDQALEFYIMVKAHLARLTRLIEPFADDPVLIQRANDLLRRFEHEVQEPAVPQAALSKHVAQKIAAARSKKKAVGERTAAHGRSRHQRAKAIVKKLEIPRRRARR